MSDNPMQPPWVDAPPVEAYPFEETHDLRSGPNLHDDLLGLLPFVGLWRGRGKGGYSTVDDFDFAQEVRISHDGRPFLHYESRSWLVGADGEALRPSGREIGWWRPAAGGDEVEMLLASPTGIMELYFGKAESNPPRLEVVTDAIVRTPTAKEVRAGQRLFGIVNGELLYAHEMAAVGEPMQPHLSARLIRVGG